MKITKENKPWWVGQAKCQHCETEYELEKDDITSIDFSIQYPRHPSRPILFVNCPVCNCQNIFTPMDKDGKEPTRNK